MFFIQSERCFSPRVKDVFQEGKQSSTSGRRPVLIPAPQEVTPASAGVLEPLTEGLHASKVLDLR
jgi:hypothetical protein